jgi:hypothetical protein
MSASIKVKGLDEALEALEVFDQPQLDKSAQKVMSAAARSLVTPIRRAAPRGKTGRLAASVSARKGKRDRPSAVVGPRGGRRGAFYRHFVIGGTRPHRIEPRHVGGFLLFGGHWVPAIEHPGSKPNPFVDRAVAANLDRVDTFVGRQLTKELGLE